MSPARSYVICCVQRTGSWLLAHTLTDTGYAGRPSDYFDEKERKTRTREWGLPSGDLARHTASRDCDPFFLQDQREGLVRAGNSARTLDRFNHPNVCLLASTLKRACCDLLSVCF